MALAIYGSPRSRTLRVLWMAVELGLAYEHTPRAFDDPALKAPAFMKRSESLAINLYRTSARD